MAEHSHIALLNLYEESVHELVQSHRKRRKVKRVKKNPEEQLTLNNFDLDGVKRIVVSPQSQRAIECEVGYDVTSENPSKYVSKINLAEQLEAQDGVSVKEFQEMKNNIMQFPRPLILLCYIPDDANDYDEFYISVTEAGEVGLHDLITKVAEDEQRRLDNAINKPIHLWRSCGSEQEVDLQIPTSNRPLLEMELETSYPIMSAKCRFKLRLAEERRDGYVNILPGRTVYENLVRKRIDACIQAIPPVRSNDAQTICTYPQNIWTQYTYTVSDFNKFTKAFKMNISNFIENKLYVFEDMVYLNSFVNFYTNDYQDLVSDTGQSDRYSSKTLKEYFSFVDFETCKGKTITNVAWHQMWTGTAAVAYSNSAFTDYTKGKKNTDLVTDAIFNVTPVLLWCFNDNLTPKLYFETPREVSVLSFCPSDENILVGGCINGQIIVWDLTNKLDKVEKEEILSGDQQTYRKLMHSLIKWMKNTRDIKVVRPAVTSDLTYSHTSTITSIKWISPYREVSRSGQIKDIPEEENRRSLQFLTSSTDGTILAWDLNASLTEKAPQTAQRKRTRLKARPAGLMSDVSPLNVLNRIFKPTFKVNILAPNSNRPLPISALSIRVTPPVYTEKYPDPDRKFDVTERMFYEPVFLRPQHPLVNQLLAGTIEGDFLTVSWEGFSFNAGAAVNKELGKLEHFAKFHDGPIMSLSRSQLFPDLILTVGGKVFALWMLKIFDKPVFWRKSKHRYTYGVWNSYLPSVFRVTRSDGCMEMWILKTRSDRYQQLFSLSGGSLGGTFTHPFELKQCILGVSDYNGALRLFLISNRITNEPEHERCYTFKFCEREVDRKLKINKWQQAWNIKNAEFIKDKKEQEAKIRHQKIELKIEKQEQILENEQKQLHKQQVEVQQPTLKSEMWRLKEEKRMKAVLLGKKALDIALLEKQRLPLIKINKDEQNKKVKMEERQDDANEIFNNTVAVLFPDAVDRQFDISSDPYDDNISENLKSELYERYLKLARSSSEFITTNKYTRPFDWLSILKEGRERRKALDGFYSRPNHKNRIIQEKKIN